MMLTRLGGVISEDGDHEEGEDKWRHGDMLLSTQTGTDGQTGEKIDFMDQICSQVLCCHSRCLMSQGVRV